MNILKCIGFVATIVVSAKSYSSYPFKLGPVITNVDSVHTKHSLGPMGAPILAIRDRHVPATVRVGKTSKKPARTAGFFCSFRAGF